MTRARRPAAGRRKDRKRRPQDLFAAVGDAKLASEERVRTLLHELQVHAEEITAQNEELRKTQAELEQARARYVDLYDFAPIGYLTLNKGGVITDVNHAGAALLGFDREFVQSLPLTAAVQPSQRLRLRQFLADCWARPLGPTATIEVRTKSLPFKLLRFTCRVQGAGRAARLFTAVVDATDERRLELERAGALERVKALIEQLVTVQEAERRRIALNLHDHIGQQLTALRLTLGTMRGAKATTPEQNRQLDTLETLTAQMDRDLDYLAWELRPVALDDVGLEAALRQFVATWSAQHGIAAEFHASAWGGDRLPGAAESNLYRITQEALNNVVKHAGATRVSVILERRLDEAILIVEDNGRGFDFDKARAARGRHAGIGLVGMEERAALIGATIQFETAPGQGSTLFVKVPVTQSRKA